MKFSGSSNISFHVNEYIRAHAGEFQGKTVVDIPAGRVQPGADYARFVQFTQSADQLLAREIAIARE